MPYTIGAKTKKGYPIIEHKNGKRKTVGHSTSKAKAQASIRARYANKNKSFTA